MKYRIGLRMVSENENLFDATLNVSDYLSRKHLDSNYIHMTHYKGPPIETVFMVRNVPKRKVKHVLKCADMLEEAVGKKPYMSFMPVKF